MTVGKSENKIHPMIVVRKVAGLFIVPLEKDLDVIENVKAGSMIEIEACGCRIVTR